MRLQTKNLLLLPAIFLSACQAPDQSSHQKPLSPSAATAQVASPAVASASPATPAPPDTTPSQDPRLSRKSNPGIEFEGVSFDSRSHRLIVIDQPNGPGSTFADAAGVARKHNALAVLNASFFTPEGAPLGLVVSRGSNAGSWNTASSLGSGVFRESSSGTLSISRRSSRAAVAGSRELIQAGPLLIENGSPVSGLDATKPAIRSIILTDGGSRWWIGKTSLCSLSDLSKALASGSPSPWKVRLGLNFDGGRSTDFYVSSHVPGGPLNRRGFMSRPVRNFIALVPRER